MLAVLKTLITGANARAEEQLRDHYSIELIEQKIRDATASLKGAKVSLAGLIQRKRGEERQAEALNDRIKDLSSRTKAALDAGEDALATEAAEAIASLENELAVRRDTIRMLESRVLRLESSVESAHRRLVDLKQGAIAAKAMRREQNMQTRIAGRSETTGNAMDEAEELIAQVMQRDVPFEQAEILREIDAGLGHETVADRMAAKGLGASAKTTASDVLARFQ